MVLFSEMSNMLLWPFPCIVLLSKEFTLYLRFIEHCFVRMKMLGHWGKKLCMGHLRKNPVIGNILEECIGEKRGKEKYWQEHETNIWCTMWWLKGEVTFILSYPKNKKSYLFYATFCVCLSSSPMPLIPWVFLDPLGLDPNNSRTSSKDCLPADSVQLKSFKW